MGNDFGFELENVLCQTHLSISHNSFSTQPRIDFLSQMRGHNKLFAVVPDTADNGNYSQTERAARGKEPTCYNIHIPRWFKRLPLVSVVSLGRLETALKSRFNIISQINQPHHKVVNGPRQCVPVRSLPPMR